MPAEYRNLEYKLHEGLVKLHQSLTILEFDSDLLELLDDCKNLIKTKRYNIAVMGEFRRGKSSLINALLGSKILPADVVPTTATINRVTYGIEPKTIIKYKDGGTEEICIDELNNHVTKLTSDGKARAELVKEATVYFPTVICQNHVDIIDTPGLNDEADMTQITIDMIADVDAVIVPIHARSPFSEIEMKFICKLIESDSISSIIFVVTFIDQLDPDDYVYDEFIDYIKRRIQTEVFAELEKRGNPHVIEKAHLLLDKLNVNGISSRMALESFVTNNAQQRKNSGFDAFYESLLHNVTAKQMENAVRKTREIIGYTILQFEAQNSKRLDVLETSLRNIDTCEEVETVRNFCAESKRVLDKAFSRYFDELQAIENSIGADKEYIVNQFIKELSVIKTDTHESIARTLDHASKSVMETVNQRLDDRKEKTRLIFSEVLSQLDARYSGKLLEATSFLGIAEDFTAQLALMSNYVEASLDMLQFEWCLSPVPSVSDLTSCNVIETVTTAADASVEKCKSDLCSSFTAIRKELFGHLRAYKDILSRTLPEVIERRQNVNNAQYNAYRDNYQRLYEEAKGIQNQCEALVA